MKNKIKSIFLACTMTVACLPFSWTSVNAATPDYSLWDKFIKYDLCITDYDSLTDEEKNLCRFIFDTEQSSDKPIRCERARRILAGDDVGKRITLEQLDGAYGIWDRFSPDKLGWHNYIHCVPDIKILTNYEKYNEYWLDDEGKNKVYFDGELCHYMPAETYDSFLVKRENDYDMEIEKKQVPFGNWSDKMIVYSSNSEQTSLNFDEAIEYEGNYYYITPDNEAVFLKCGNCMNSIYDAEKAEPITEPLIVPEEINGYPLTAIEEEAFRYSLYTEVVLPENLKFIDRRAFAGSPYIQKINFPKELEYIGSSILSSCPIKTININCPNLIISDDAFSASIVTDVNVNAKIIGEGAFQNCTYLENLTLGENIKKIEADAFLNCTSLEKVTFPKSLEVIGANAFSSDKNKITLREVKKTVEIPNTVKVIGALPKAVGEEVLSGLSSQGTHPLTDPLKCSFDSDCTINGWYGTEAHSYAIEWGLKFNPIDENIAYGDLNADNSIDIADAVLMYSYISGHEVTVGFEADLTRDGIIDAFDMAAMRKNLIA